MKRVLVSRLHINKVRHLQGITIPLEADDGRIRHLILTGKNGSGKTGVLDAIAGYIDVICEGAVSQRWREVLTSRRVPATASAWS